MTKDSGDHPALPCNLTINIPASSRTVVIKLLPLLLLATLASAPAAALASNITYNVSILEPGASVTGTITTDGTLGTLQQSDFLGANLVFTTGNATVVGYGEYFTFDQAPLLTATASGLFFNFDDPQFSGLYIDSIDAPPQHDGSQNAGLLLCSANSLANPIYAACGTNGSHSPAGGVLNIGTQNTDLGFAQTGNFEFASNPNAPAVTPEPSSLILLATGLIGIGTRLRRRITYGSHS